MVLRVETKYLPDIPADSMTNIGSDTLIGNKYVDIDAGKNPIPVAEEGELRSEPAAQAADQADLIYGLRDSLRKSGHNDPADLFAGYAKLATILWVRRNITRR